MKSLKNIFVLVGLFWHTAFSDVSCIYNRTDGVFFVKKIETGSWVFEHFTLDEKDLLRFDKILEDSESSTEVIPPQSGFLVKYKYGYKKGSKATSILLISADKKNKIDIDLTDDKEGTVQQGIYQVTQEYTSPSNVKKDHEERKWWLSCDKMIIISDEN